MGNCCIVPEEKEPISPIRIKLKRKERYRSCLERRAVIKYNRIEDRWLRRVLNQ